MGITSVGSSSLFMVFLLTSTSLPAPLLIGSIPGILVGGRLTLKVPELFLRVLIIAVLLFTGMKMI